MPERQIPGGAYYNDQGTTREAQIPGFQYVNEEAAAEAAVAEVPNLYLVHSPLVWS